ncbi:MAG: ATP-binding cassette domain-containing protein [Bdellovibrionota bacterium]|jgi:branched-chain amino acid transport system ATP-binding protein
MTEKKIQIEKKILSLQDLYCGYGTRPVLKGINFIVHKGESVLLAGPNGCGKSTLLKAIAGVVPLSSGTISFNGAVLDHNSIEERINSGIGYLRQTGNIFPSQTVSENLRLSGLTLTTKEFSSALERVLALFDFLRNRLEDRAGTLSGGQRQALAIAMVLLHKRKLYLFDEPTAGLAPKAARDIIERIRRFSKEDSEQSVVIVEHRLELLDWVDRAVILLQGEVKVESEDASQFLNPEWLAKHYF